MSSKKILISWLFVFSSLRAIEEPTCLPVCPSSPNCVCSCDLDSHYIEPFLLYIDAVSSLNLLEEILLAYPRTKIIKREEKYIHAEFYSLIFRFVDDGEFLFDEKKKVIDIRSSSRVGYSDLGVNRSRIKKLRKLYLKKMLIVNLH